MQQESSYNAAIVNFIQEKNRPVTNVELEALELNDLDSELQKLLAKNLM